MKKIGSSSYNERLFTSGIRARLHYSRFHWVADRLRRLGGDQRSVVELGCFDGKTLDFLPTKPDIYCGLDENWEGGLDAAKVKWESHPTYRFLSCSGPSDIRLSEQYDLSLCMETFEHIPPELVEPYIIKLAELTRRYMVVTVPNEKGPVFAVKYIAKRLWGSYQTYSFIEFLNASVGRLGQVPRNDHKGFDYAWVIGLISRHMRVVEVSPYPFRLLPNWLGFGVGIVAVRK